jgi:hypothetical protein
MLPMVSSMAATDEIELCNRVDAVIGYSGLVLRALAYTFIAVIADQYDCGRALLTGVLAGDMLSRLFALALDWRDQWISVVSELILLGIVFLFVRSSLVWPDEQAMRAILGLAAFGTFSAQVGGSLLTRLGPGENGFS